MLCLHVLSNTQATLEVQFMKKLRNTEAELKKRVRQKTKTLKRQKSIETVVNQKIHIVV